MTDGHLVVARILLENGADIHALDDHALRWAATNGHLDVVRILHSEHSEALTLAQQNGRHHIVHLFTTYSAQFES